MSELDIRWRQRLANYSKALEQLGNAVATSRQRPLSELEKQGLIQAFESTHELAWNVMKDYFAWQGNPGITGSRDAVREAFQQGLIEDGEGWMEMIEGRNQSSHTYQQKVADEIAEYIVERYFPLFQRFLHKINTPEDLLLRTMQYGLKTDTIARINGVLAAHPEIEQAILYGSRAKGNYREGSDIDLCLAGGSLTLTQLLKIDNELDDLLLPYKIDLSLFHALENPELIDHIRRVGVAFYQKEQQTDRAPSG